MPQEKSYFLLDITTIALSIILMIMPLLLPDYPVSYVETMICIPTLDVWGLIFLVLILFAILDFLTLLLIKKRILFPKISSKGRIILMIAFTSSILIYGIIVELLIFIELLNAGFVLFFIITGYLSYVISRMS